MKVIILVLTVFLIFLLVLYSVKENFQQQMNKCLYEFKPYGKSVADCSSKCLQNNIKTRGSCSRGECNIICQECNTSDCEWKRNELNKQNELKPDPIRIKVFSGNKCLKINWVKPYSEFDISKYYVIVSSKSHSKRPFFLEIYTGKPRRQLRPHGNHESQTCCRQPRCRMGSPSRCRHAEKNAATLAESDLIPAVRFHIRHGAPPRNEHRRGRFVAQILGVFSPAAVRFVFQQWDTANSRQQELDKNR